MIKATILSIMSRTTITSPRTTLVVVGVEIVEEVVKLTAATEVGVVGEVVVVKAASTDVVVVGQAVFCKSSSNRSSSSDSKSIGNNNHNHNYNHFHHLYQHHHYHHHHRRHCPNSVHYNVILTSPNTTASLG